MKHMHPCLTARNDRESTFHRCGGHVKLVQASLSARESRDISFYHSGCRENLVQACLFAVKT